MLPKARVLYCSATGVTDVKNMVSKVPRAESERVLSAMQYRNRYNPSAFTRVYTFSPVTILLSVYSS